MSFIDTHTHLFLKEFDKDRDLAIKNAQFFGIDKLLLPNVDTTTIEPMMELVKKYPGTCFPMIGIHPTSIKDNYEEDLANVEEWLAKEKFVAVGEIGIDLYWDKTHLKEQTIAFKKQIELALRYNLPIVIHSRDSFYEIYEVLEEMNCDKLKGVFHCFGGTLEQAQKIINLGFKLGIGGVVTFKNSGLDKIVKEIDLKHIVLETDSPYLAPVPQRGNRNESSYIMHIANKIAELHNTTFDKVGEITTQNALEVFDLNI